MLNPLLKPHCHFDRKLSTKLRSWLQIMFSKVLKIPGNMLTGPELFSDAWKYELLAHFKQFGNFPVSKERLKNLAI